MREKLIELLEEAPIYWDEINGLDRNRIADHLIANGVTVRAKGEWENWEPRCIGMRYSYDMMQCSECGVTMANAKRIPANYCYNCGADMRGDT